jgi:N-acetylglucosamine-6-phosphate deacetylase
MADTRIYVITPRAGGKQRLVRATHPANAMRHVAAQAFGVAVAAQETLVDLIADGVKER